MNGIHGGKKNLELLYDLQVGTSRSLPTFDSENVKPPQFWTVFCVTADKPKGLQHKGGHIHQQ